MTLPPRRFEIRTMMDASDSFALRARYVFPVDSPPLPDGLLTISGERIAAVGENRSKARPLDLGNVALLPGLVNAHTHLEFSGLAAPLGGPTIAFPDWIREVIAARRSVEAAPDAAAERRAAVSRGLTESVARGTTMLGDIATPAWSSEPYCQHPLDCTVFLELLGSAADRLEPLMHAAGAHLAAGKSSRGGWRPGLSPHAPYTVRLELLERASRLSAEAQAPLAMHLAETLEELELLGSGGGPLFEVLVGRNAWDPSAVPRGIQPLDYLHILAGAQRALVIHGNFLSKPEIAFLAQRADRMSVVYCPRTHAYFGHGRYPLAAMLAQGVNVALGTDSRASNPDLSVLEEMRFVARNHAEIAPADVLRLGSLAGAKALGLDQQTGSLTAGKRADLTVVRLPDREAADPHELLFDSTEPVERTLSRGRRLA